jgi:hypothetical protein
MFSQAAAPGTAAGMTDEQDTQQGTAPSEPDHDPTQNPAPPSNPPSDDEAVEKSYEQLDKIAGN